MVLSIFSCVCWQSIYLLWRNVYLGLLRIFGLSCLFFVLFCFCFYSNFICNCPKLHPTQMTLPWRMDKIMVVHLYNGKPISNKKERTTNTHNSILKSQMHYAEWNKQDSKSYIFYNSTYKTSFQKQNYGGIKSKDEHGSSGWLLRAW